MVLQSCPHRMRGQDIPRTLRRPKRVSASRDGGERVHWHRLPSRRYPVLDCRLALITSNERGLVLGFLSNLRDVKSSLASGMILLFTLWLIFGNEIADVSIDDSVVGNLRRLVEYIGPAGTLGLVIFVAYVAGMVVTSHAWINLVIEQIDRLFARDTRWPRSQAVSEQTRLRFDSFLRSTFWEASRKSSDEEVLKVLNMPFTSELGKKIDEAETEPERREEMIRQTVSFLEYYVHSSLDILAVQLHSKKERSWDRYDKALAESEFRAGIAGPLCLLGIVLTWRTATEQNWILAGVALAVSSVVCSSLALKARRKRQEATEEVINAIIVGDLEVAPLSVLMQIDSKGNPSEGNFIRRVRQGLIREPSAKSQTTQ